MKNATATIGSRPKKHHRQPIVSVTIAPRPGPRNPGTTQTAASSASIRARPDSGYALAMAPYAIVYRAAPPQPWITRAAASRGIVGAKPQSTLPATNTAVVIAKGRPGP